MSELKMVKHPCIRDDIELGNHPEATFHAWSDLDLIIACGQIAMSNPHALFHCDLVQLPKVVDLGHTLWLCLAVVVQEWRIVVWNAFFIFNIAKCMEQILV